MNNWKNVWKKKGMKQIITTKDGCIFCNAEKYISENQIKKFFLDEVARIEKEQLEIMRKQDCLHYQGIETKEEEKVTLDKLRNLMDDWLVLEGQLSYVKKLAGVEEK